jgi:hypothetical protein
MLKLVLAASRSWLVLDVSEDLTASIVSAEVRNDGE